MFKGWFLCFIEMNTSHHMQPYYFMMNVIYVSRLYWCNKIKWRQSSSWLFLATYVIFPQIDRNLSCCFHQKKIKKIHAKLANIPSAVIAWHYACTGACLCALKTQRRNANEMKAWQYLLLSHFVLGGKVHGCILPPDCLRGDLWWQVLSSKSGKCYSLSLLEPRISLLRRWGS